jgi:two-component system, response regulator
MNTEIEIILIEDSPADTDITIRALKKYNVANKLTCFKNGAEALEFVEKETVSNPDRIASMVILLDLYLPLMNGLEFLQAIKANEKTKNIPVAILSSTNELPDIKESLRRGVRYISKPLEFEDLIRFTIEVGYSTLLVKTGN